VSDQPSPPGRTLTRREISEAVGDLGWRYVLGSLRTAVPVTSLAQGSEVTARAVAACQGAADDSLWLDVRRDRVVMCLQSVAAAAVTPRELELAGLVSAAVEELGLWTGPEVGQQGTRSVQVLEIAVDALDIPSVRPFWKAVMGYVDEPGRNGPVDPLVDPVDQGPAIWFQQMDRPRRERNRIHFDVSVPHDEADHRVRAALEAGGVLVTDANAPAWWVLADAEGNEVCVTTWQGRD
jgi:4a-hydroxytetrahydrobiopterin dehydratase